MKKLKENQILFYTIIIIIAIIMCIPLFKADVHTGHDGDFHISRTIGTIEQIKNGESPFVISRFSNNLGFGWNLFYPPISTITNIIFAILTNDVVIAMRIFIFCTFLFSGIFMFKFVSEISKNNVMALIASAIYMCAPYRMLNAYIRLAVGEMLGFVFIPIIFIGICRIFNKDTKHAYIFVFGTIGLVLSHNISTMLVFIIGVAYVLMNIKKLKDKQILKTLIVSGIIIVLSVLFFEIPLLEQKASCEYEVFRYGKMYSKDSVQGHALNPLQLLYRNAPGADDSMFFCIGIPILIGLALTPFVKVEDELKRNYKFFFIVGAVATVMSTFIFPWIVMPDIVLMVQFPWRLLAVIVFCFSIISGINISLFIDKIIKDTKKQELIKNIILIIFIVLSCIYALTFILKLDYEYKDSKFYEQEEIIDTKYEVSRYSSFLEYWPQKAVRNIEYVASRDDKVSVISGNAKIENETKRNGILDFDINNVEENTKLELPYLFYKGYQVSYTKAGTSEKTMLQTVESEKGLLQINIEENMNGHINVEYHITKLHKACIIMSITTMLGYLTYVIISRKK